MTSANNKNLFKKRYTRRQMRTGDYRSKFEKTTAETLEGLGISYLYEKEKIKYVKPVTNHTYTPDFRIESCDWYIECKGLFTAEDRKKHLYIKEQGGPEIRFLFYNAHAKLRKGSPTSYANWCDKNGFEWAHKIIPEEWLNVNTE